MQTGTAANCTVSPVQVLSECIEVMLTEGVMSGLMVIVRLFTALSEGNAHISSLVSTTFTISPLAGA